MKPNKVVKKKMRQLSHATIERAAMGIFWLDSNGMIKSANQAACRILGYTAASFPPIKKEALWGTGKCRKMYPKIVYNIRQIALDNKNLLAY